MPKFKHLSLNDRIIIQKSLAEGSSFKTIGKLLGYDCTSIAKEVKKHLLHKKTGQPGRPFNNCLHRFDCDYYFLCNNSSCKKKRLCKFCSKCYTVCPDYEEYVCPNLSKPPYVCNGCKSYLKCTLEKSLYDAREAQRSYESLLRESRSGISIDEQEVLRLDNFISPLILKGQSLHHICSNNRDIVMHSEKSIYNYVGYGIFSARNIDLPRKVRYKLRKRVMCF